VDSGKGPAECQLIEEICEQYGRNAVYFPTMFLWVGEAPHISLFQLAHQPSTMLTDDRQHAGSAVFFIPVGAGRNIATVLVGRFLCGACGSTGSTMVGGTLADMWETHERGTPMVRSGFGSCVSVFFGCSCCVTVARARLCSL
jgi:MFS family permease